MKHILLSHAGMGSSTSTDQQELCQVHQVQVQVLDVLDPSTSSTCRHGASTSSTSADQQAWGQEHQVQVQVLDQSSSTSNFLYI